MADSNPAALGMSISALQHPSTASTLATLLSALPESSALLALMRSTGKTLAPIGTGLNLSPELLSVVQEELHQLMLDSPALGSKLTRILQHAAAVPPGDHLWALAQGAFLTSDFLAADRYLAQLSQLQRGSKSPWANTIHDLNDILLFRSVVRRISGHDADADALIDMAAVQAAKVERGNVGAGRAPHGASVCGEPDSIVTKLLQGLSHNGFASFDSDAGIFDSNVLESAANEAAQLLARGEFVDGQGLQQLRVALSAEGGGRGAGEPGEGTTINDPQPPPQALVCDKQRLHVEEKWSSDVRQGSHSWRESGLFAIQRAMKKLVLGVNRCGLHQAHVPLETQLAFFADKGTKYSVHRDTQRGKTAATAAGPVGPGGGASVDRSLTLIMYLNGPAPLTKVTPDSGPARAKAAAAGERRAWDPADGGELLIYPRPGVVRRFAPIMGRLVAYWSNLEHEVTTNWQPRFSFTVWSSTCEQHN
jgi:hypothetical protein